MKLTLFPTLRHWQTEFKLNSTRFSWYLRLFRCLNSNFNCLNLLKIKFELNPTPFSCYFMLFRCLNSNFKRLNLLKIKFELNPTPFSCRSHQQRSHRILFNAFSLFKCQFQTFKLVKNQVWTESNWLFTWIPSATITLNTILCFFVVLNSN